MGRTWSSGRSRTTRTLLLALGAVALAASRPALGEPTPRASPSCALGALTSSEPPRPDQLLGQVVYVDFWASWCAPCAEAFPLLNELQRELGPLGLQVIGVSVDEQPAAARAFLAEHRADFAVGSDAAAECQQAYGVELLPTGYLVDRLGRIRYLYRGQLTAHATEVRRRLLELLAEPGPRPRDPGRSAGRAGEPATRP